MRVIISIATMNSRDLLRDCLGSLPAACEGLEWQVVVVDNCSSDGTMAMLRNEHPWAEVRRNAVPQGFGANHNQVLRAALAANGDDACVLVLNDDTVASPGSIRQLAECLEREPAPGAVTPQVVGIDGVRQPTAFRSLPQRISIARAFLGGVATPENRDGADWLNACCLLIPLGVLRTVGLFDERFFMYSEDVDLTLRIKARGFRLWQCDESTIVHLGARTTRQPSHSAAMQLQAARSYYLLLEKHRGVTVATLSTTALRLAHLLRGTAAFVAGAMTKDDRRRRSSRVRLRLARYSARRAVFPERERGVLAERPRTGATVSKVTIVDRALRSPRLRNSFFRASQVPILSLLQRTVARRVVPLGQMRWIEVPGGLNKGLRMQVDPRSELGYLRGDHEPWIQDLLAEWLSAGDAFVDVGSHAGFFTIAASRLVGHAGTVIAVEPDSATFARLRQHVSENGLANVRLVAAAAFDRVGMVQFASSRASDSGVRGFVTSERTESSYVVDATTLDALTHDVTPAVIKIDVEGGELSALAGASRLLATRASKWIVEVHSEALREEVLRIFQAAGYDVEHTAPRRGDYGQDYVIAVAAT